MLRRPSQHGREEEGGKKQLGMQTQIFDRYIPNIKWLPKKLKSSPPKGHILYQLPSYKSPAGPPLKAEPLNGLSM